MVLKDIMFATLIFFVILLLYPIQEDSIYRHNYLANAISLLIIITMLVSYKINNGLDIFEPIVFISVIYLSMYFITPMIDIVIGEYLWFGYDLFPYGIKATFIALAGYISFFIGYIIRIKKYTAKNNQTNKDIKLKPTLNIFILVMYLICFILTVFYITRTRGISLNYILTLGYIGEVKTNSISESSVGYLSMFSYCLPACALLYSEYGNSKGLKVVLFYLMIITQIVIGFRFIIIQVAVTFTAYYYIKKGKRPRLNQIISLFLILIIPLVIMTLFRDSIRSGRGIDTTLITLQGFFDGLNNTFLENLRIYKNFYGMVEAIPKRFDYVYLRQIVIGTIVMFVPRSIIPSKITSYGGEGLRTLIGPNIASGQAYPNIGEFYYAFGAVGVMFFMFIYGCWAKMLRTKYMGFENCNLSIMIFALLLGVNLQIIIRGYTPSNFYLIIFSVLPIYLVKLYLRIR